MWLDILIGVLVAAAVLLAIVKLVRDRRRNSLPCSPNGEWGRGTASGGGRGCCGCAACPHSDRCGR